MSYRLPDTPPEVRKPGAMMVDVARPGFITVDNGTITRINIPCSYSRRMSRHDMMVWDHIGWPSPDSPDRSDYAPFLQARPIDLEGEGYSSVSVVLGEDVPGLLAYATIDHDMIVLTVSVMCEDANSSDLDVRFAIYAIGVNDEVGQLRDLVTKGVIHVVAGCLAGSSPTPPPTPTPTDAYVITYDGNGGTGYVPPQAGVSGTVVTISSNGYERSGYAFLSWNTAADGTGTQIEAGAQVTLTDDLTLYAQWVDEIVGYWHITFDGNGSDFGQMDQQDIVKGASANLSPNAYGRTGYQFSSWNALPYGDGTSYANAEVVTPVSDMTLYAQWAEVRTVIFNPNGATGTGFMQSVLAGQSLILPRCAWSKSGYQFRGWCTKTNRYVPGAVVYQVGDSFTPLGSYTSLYALWE